LGARPGPRGRAIGDPASGSRGAARKVNDGAQYSDPAATHVVHLFDEGPERLPVTLFWTARFFPGRALLSGSRASFRVARLSGSPLFLGRARLSGPRASFGTASVLLNRDREGAAPIN
jgi:hypothetical protein